MSRTAARTMWKLSSSHSAAGDDGSPLATSPANDVYTRRSATVCRRSVFRCAALPRRRGDTVNRAARRRACSSNGSMPSRSIDGGVGGRAPSLFIVVSIVVAHSPPTAQKAIDSQAREIRSRSVDESDTERRNNVAQGTHDDLIAASTLYGRLAKHLRDPGVGVRESSDQALRMDALPARMSVR